MALTGVGTTRSVARPRFATSAHLFPAPVVATTAVITPFLIDGFGHGIPSTVSGPYDTVGGAPTIVTSPIRGNTVASLHIDGFEYARYTYSSQIVAASFYVRFPTSLPATDAELMTFFVTSATYMFGFDTTTGQFFVSTDNGTTQVTGHTALAANTWYRVTLEIDATANPHVFRASVDNGTEWQTTRALAATSATNVNIGNSSTLGVSTNDYSAFVLSVTNGDYEVMRDWTAHDVEILRPTSDGTHSIAVSGDFLDDAAVAISNATTDAWQRFDEFPMQVGNSTANRWIRQFAGTTGQYFEVLLGNLLAGGSYTVEAVRTYLEYDQNSTGATLSEVRLLLSDDTEVLTTGALSVRDSTDTDSGTTDTMFGRMAINPSGGWDRTKVDGLKTRFGFGDNTPVPYFIDFGVEVLVYSTTPPPVPAVTFAAPDLSIFPTVIT